MEVAKGCRYEEEGVARVGSRRRRRAQKRFGRTVGSDSSDVLCCAESAAAAGGAHPFASTIITIVLMVTKINKKS
jgi:hypothetical protein